VEVEFITSAADLAGRPEEVLPEFAFVGRSNCGKSSLINYFLGRKSVARTSGTPGKTRLLNYFLINDRYYLVDLPGYGFAKVGKVLRESWLRLMRAYLFAGDRPLAVFMLVDVRHAPSVEDREMASWLREAGHPFALAVTKIDKIGTTKLEARYREIVQTLDLPPNTPFFPTSAAKRRGGEDMRTWVAALLDDADQD